MRSPLEFRSLSIVEVGPIWQSMRSVRNLKPRTHERTDEALTALGKFFGDLPIGAITAGHLREYQVAREKNELRLEEGIIRPWSKAAGNSCINHELNVLKQIMEAAGLWERVKPHYSTKPVPSWSPREIPNIDEEVRIFQKGAADPGAALALWVAMITANTSASGSELRYMRLRHLFLPSPFEEAQAWIWIPEEGCKNNVRPRKIPLNETARWAFEQIYERALRLGSTDADHFLFPFRVKRGRFNRADMSTQKGHFDPGRPASRWFLRKAWAQLRQVTGLPKLSPHDLRHLFCSRMILDAKVQDKVVQALMGHKTSRMTDYYLHVQMEPKTDAVDRLERRSIMGPKPPARERRLEPREDELKELRRARLIAVPARGAVQ
ncbi:MAG: tyrosine-type recombinase/integrase [Acidobacteria bacterium]|nr:tyrosine-type recombinase/integrase [Acidobacteriota bacterium]